MARSTGRSPSTTRRRITPPSSSLPGAEMSFAQIREHARGRLERLGNAVTSSVWRLGFASRFLFYLVAHSGTALRRLRRTVAEIYFAGVLSLIIIMVSGLFVGMVLALQGYDTLQRFGASESLGVLVALSLARELSGLCAAAPGGPGGRWWGCRWGGRGARWWRGWCARAAPAPPSPPRSD